MEAKTHEDISRETAEFLYAYLNDTGKNFGVNKNNLIAALYLGNWLTDMSQLFVPDAVHEKRVIIRKTLEKYNDGIDHIFKVFDVEDNFLMLQLFKVIATSSIFDIPWPESIKGTNLRDAKKIIKQKYTNNSFRKKDLDTINTIFKVTKNNFKQLKENNSTELGSRLKRIHTTLKIEQSTLDRIKSNKVFNIAEREEIWELANSMIRLKGFSKFGYYGKDALGFDKEDNPEMLIRAIFDEMIPMKGDTRPISKVSNSLFYNLDTYYPLDHLDRPFDWRKLPNALPKDATYFRKDDYWHDKIYEDQIKEGTREEADKKYDYIVKYLEVLGGQLTELNSQIAKSYFWGEDIADIEFYKLTARLGQTLHMAEDFFAHSNYLELLVKNLDKTRFIAEGFNDNMFYTTSDVIAKLGKNHSDEHNRYTNALKSRKLLKITPKGEYKYIPINEDKIVTGVFGDNDLIISLSHLLLDQLNEISKEADYSGRIMELANIIDAGNQRKMQGIQTNGHKSSIDSISLFFILINDILDKDPIKDDSYFETLKIKYPNFQTEIKPEVIEFIFQDSLNSFGFKFNETDRELIGSVLNSVRRFYAFITESMDISTTNAYASEFQSIIKLTSLMLAAIFTRQFALYLTGMLFSTINEYVRSIFPNIVVDLVEELVNNIIYWFLTSFVESVNLIVERHIGELDKPKNFGSHSIIAKDEKIGKSYFFALATQAALVINKTIIYQFVAGNNESKTSSIQSVDFIKLINDLFLHPLDSSKEILATDQSSVPDVEIPRNYYYVGDVLGDEERSIAQIYNDGLRGKIPYYSIDEFRERFLFYNFWIDSEIINRSDYTLGNLRIDQRDEKITIFVPDQIPTMIPSGYSLDSNRGYPNPVYIRSIEKNNLNKYQNWGKILFLKENFNTDEIQDAAAKKILQNLKRNLYEKPGQYNKDKFVADKLLVEKIIEPEVIDKEKIDYQINSAIDLDKSLKAEYQKFLQKYLKLKIGV